jgi:hypothetical protein
MDQDNESEPLLVYRYRYWDPESNQVKVSTEMFTLEAIKDGLGVPVFASGIKVLRSKMNEYGHYVPEHGHHAATSRESE